MTLLDKEQEKVFSGTSLNMLEELRAELDKQGIKLEDLLLNLDLIREQIYQERYGEPISGNPSKFR